MEIFTVALFGHREIRNIFEVEKPLEKHIRELIREKEYVEFIIGRNGDFDILAASVIRRCRRLCGDCNSALTLYLPYMTAEYRDNEEAYRNYYTDIAIPSELYNTHPKNAITMRNKIMVDIADLVIFYVDYPAGGAYSAYKYAVKHGKHIINLSEIIREK